MHVDRLPAELERKPLWQEFKVQRLFIFCLMRMQELVLFAWELMLGAD